MQKASRIAIRHGLSVPFSRGLSQQAEVIAEAIAGPRRDAGTRYFAKEAADAMIEVQRARLARAHVIDRVLERGSAVDESLLLHAQRIERYERRAWSRRRRAMQVL